MLKPDLQLAMGIVEDLNLNTRILGETAVKSWIFVQLTRVLGDNIKEVVIGKYFEFMNIIIGG